MTPADLGMDKLTRYKFIREHTKTLAIVINNLCPEGQEKNLALSKLAESLVWAAASIARSE